MALLTNVHMYYVKIKNPALEYQAKAVKDKPHMNKECVIDVLIGEKVYKAFKKHYKGVKAVKDAREFDAEEFEKAFKVAPPYEADTYYVIKFKKRAYYKNDGKPSVKPAVVGRVGQTKDLKGLEVNADVEIGNGSRGQVQFTERTWDNEFGKGMALDLKAICIEELVEYVAKDSLEFEFDDAEEGEFGSEVGFGDDEDEGSDDVGSDAGSDEGW